MMTQYLADCETAQKIMKEHIPLIIPVINMTVFVSQYTTKSRKGLSSREVQISVGFCKSVKAYKQVDGLWFLW